MGWVMHITVRGLRVMCRARGGGPVSGRSDEARGTDTVISTPASSDAQPSLNYQASLLGPSLLHDSPIALHP
eukprot:881361-Prymnesium_polylepis.1